MDMFNVLLDTNVFIKAQYDFYGGSLLNFKNYCNDGFVCMYTNDIITREVLHHIESDVGSLASQAKNAIKKHGELINAITKPIYNNIKTILFSAPKELTAKFEKYMEGSICISNNNVSVIELFNDYFNFIAPFESRKEKKNEFPDATVISSIKHLVADKEDFSIHIVTDDKGWHTALDGIPGIIVHKDIKTLLELISQKQENLYNQINSFIYDEFDSIEKHVDNWLKDQEWDFVVDNLDICIESDGIDEIDVKDITLSLDAIEYIDAKDGYAVATFSGIADLMLKFSYIDHTEETYDKELHMWYNTIYGNGITNIQIPIALSVTVAILEDEGFDLEEFNFKDINSSNVEIIKQKLIQKNEYLYEPYYNICPDCYEKIGHHNDGGNGFCINCAPEH